MKLMTRWLLITAITGLLTFVVSGTYLIHEDIELARGNEYMAEHIAESIRFSLTHSAFAVALMSLLFVQIPFWLTEIIRKNKSVNDKKFTKYQLLIMPIIATAVFIVLLVIWILAHLEIPF